MHSGASRSALPTSVGRGGRRGEEEGSPETVANPECIVGNQNADCTHMHSASGHGILQCSGNRILVRVPYWDVYDREYRACIQSPVGLRGVPPPCSVVDSGMLTRIVVYDPPDLIGLNECVLQLLEDFPKGPRPQ